MIVTDLINALSGSSSVNTVQHATIQEAVFSVDPTDAPVDWLDSDRVICVYYRSMSVPWLCTYVNKSDRIRSEQLRVMSELSRQKNANKRAAVSCRSAEEYKKSACEDLTCDLKTMCAIVQWYSECVI
jgi:hypothetical protein